MKIIGITDYRAAAEDLIELELRDQVTGKVIDNGKGPCIVLVRSTMSADILAEDRAAKNAAMKEMFRRARAKKDDATEEEDIEFDWNEIEAKIEERAEKLVAGFKNMQAYIQDDDGNYIDNNGNLVTQEEFIEAMVSGKDLDLQTRDLTLDDVPELLKKNHISEEHHWRNVIPLSKNDDESDKEFKARKAQVEAEWLGASFAQQIVDAAKEHADFLGKRAKR